MAQSFKRRAMSSKSVLSSLDKCINLSYKSPEKTPMAPASPRYHRIDVPEGRVFSSLGISGKARAADREISRLSRLSINAEPLVPKEQASSKKRKERSIHQLEKKDFQAGRDAIQSASSGSSLNSPRSRSKEPIDEKIRESSENLSNCQPLKRRRCGSFKRSSLSPFSLDGSSND